MHRHRGVLDSKENKTTKNIDMTSGQGWLYILLCTRPPTLPSFCISHTGDIQSRRVRFLYGSQINKRCIYQILPTPQYVSILVLVVQTWSPQQCLKVEEESRPLLIRYAREGIIRVNSSQTWHQSSQGILVVTLKSFNLRGLNLNHCVSVHMQVGESKYFNLK